MTNENTDIVLLLSGGMDSAVLLQMALASNKKIFCLIMDYGQRHIKEVEYATQMCLKHGIAFKVITLGGFNVRSKLTEGTPNYEGVSEWHVPARNLIFIALAASYAESFGAPLVWYGANYEDREHLFPDCYQEWVFKLNELLKINGSRDVKVEAPLLGMQKETIRELAKQFNINENQILSGYGKE